MKDIKLYEFKELIQSYAKVAYYRSLSRGRIWALKCECWKMLEAIPLAQYCFGAGKSLAVEFIRICRHARDSEDVRPSGNYRGWDTGCMESLLRDVIFFIWPDFKIVAGSIASSSAAARGEAESNRATGISVWQCYMPVSYVTILRF